MIFDTLGQTLTIKSFDLDIVALRWASCPIDQHRMRSIRTLWRQSSRLKTFVNTPRHHARQHLFNWTPFRRLEQHLARLRLCQSDQAMRKSRLCNISLHSRQLKRCGEFFCRVESIHLLLLGQLLSAKNGTETTAFSQQWHRNITPCLVVGIFPWHTTTVSH